MESLEMISREDRKYLAIVEKRKGRRMFVVASIKVLGGC